MLLNENLIQWIHFKDLLSATNLSFIFWVRGLAHDYDYFEVSHVISVGIG